MKYIIYGLACSKKKFNEYIKENKLPYSVAHNLFENKLIENLEKEIDITHYRITQIANDKIIKEEIDYLSEKTQSKTIKHINIKVLKYFTLFFSTFFINISNYIKYKKNQRIISTINYLPVALANILFSKIFRIKNYIIFTDCSESYALQNSNSKIVKIYKKIMNMLENSYDGYILFSKPMNELVNKNKRPYIVMEGIMNQDNLTFEEKTIENQKFTIIYSGSIMQNLGLENLIEAVSLCKDLKLDIYGDGSHLQDLKNSSKNIDNVYFHGFKAREEIYKKLHEAELLINTRNPNDLYTRYSFPSKTFEYLLSGTPFLSTRLECYGQEYNDYIYFIDNNEVKTIIDKILEIKNTVYSERLKFGSKAREFILSEKNDVIQCNKIIEFITEDKVYE